MPADLALVHAFQVADGRGGEPCEVAVLAARRTGGSSVEPPWDGQPPSLADDGLLKEPVGLILLAAAMIARGTGRSEIAACLEEASARPGYDG